MRYPFSDARKGSKKGVKVWKSKCSLFTTAETVLGFECQSHRNQWYNKEYSEIAAAKNAAYKKMLQSTAKRAIVENYSERRRNEIPLFRRKKRQ